MKSYQARITFIVIVFITFVLIALIGVMPGCGGSDVGTAQINPIKCGDTSNIYVSVAGSNNNPGTITLPLRTIQAALSCGQPGQAIRVATGIYETSYEGGVITLSNGQSLYGGYSSDFQTRSPDIYTTTINDITDMTANTTGSACAITTSDTTMHSTVIDGFNINGALAGTGGDVHGICVYGSPIIQNNIINGGGTDMHFSSIGLEVLGGGPTILNNYISGGVASSNTWGIKAITSKVNLPVMISKNDINGGSDSNTSFGIHLVSDETEAFIISNNSIHGGAAGITYGIMLETTASTVIESNTIISGYSFADPSTRTFQPSTGIYSTDSTTIIRNNVIVLTGGYSYGVATLFNSSINSNTIVGGGLGPSSGIVLGGVTSAVQNNIIELNEKGYAFSCIREPNVSARPAVLKNNNLYGCTSLYYGGISLDLTNIAEVNALAVIDADSNISYPSILDDTQDYRLTDLSPIEVTQGGLDLSVEFDTDKAGNLRTLPYWSIGAYEYD